MAKEGWKTAATEFDGMLGKHKGESVAEAVPKLTEWLKAQSLEFPIELDANGKRVLPNAPASVGDCEVYADAVLGPQPRCYFNARLAAESVGWPRLACLDASGAVLDDVPPPGRSLHGEGRGYGEVYGGQHLRMLDEEWREDPDRRGK
ncbi:MAG: hypothetical protein IPJ34_43205 [Myxococcales bacterium]|nr:hypothetical protein [Myxococcales bacterium]